MQNARKDVRNRHLEQLKAENVNIRNKYKNNNDNRPHLDWLRTSNQYDAHSFHTFEYLSHESSKNNGAHIKYSNNNNSNSNINNSKQETRQLKGKNNGSNSGKKLSKHSKNQSDSSSMSAANSENKKHSCRHTRSKFRSNSNKNRSKLGWSIANLANIGTKSIQIETMEKNRKNKL